MQYIYEMAIYDGGLKDWRILNLNSGSFYCTKYKSQQEAEANIKEGELRGGKAVKKITRLDALALLDQNEDHNPTGHLAMTQIFGYDVRFWQDSDKYYNRIKRPHGDSWTDPSCYYSSLEACREDARETCQYWDEEASGLHQ